MMERQADQTNPADQATPPDPLAQLLDQALAGPEEIAPAATAESQALDQTTPGQQLLTRSRGRPLSTRPNGRPSEFSQDVADRIIHALENTPGASLFSITRSDKAPDWAPDFSTVLRWSEARPEFRETLARARQVAAHRLADECLAIADDDSRDTIEWQTEHGNRKSWGSTAAVQRDAMRIKSRQWAAAKLLPSVYGDQLAVDLSGQVSVTFATDFGKPDGGE